MLCRSFESEDAYARPSTCLSMGISLCLSPRQQGRYFYPMQCSPTRLTIFSLLFLLIAHHLKPPSSPVPVSLPSVANARVTRSTHISTQPLFGTPTSQSPYHQNWKFSVQLPSNRSAGSMAERLTTNQEVPGSTPGWIVSFCCFGQMSTRGALSYVLMEWWLPFRRRCAFLMICFITWLMGHRWRSRSYDPS